MLVATVIAAVAFGSAWALLRSAQPVAPVDAATDDVSISDLSCDSAPEYVRVHNYGGDSQSLSGFRLQSDTPSGIGQDCNLAFSPECDSASRS